MNKGKNTIQVVPSVNDRIRGLLRSSAKLCGVRVILHDYLARVWLPRELREHLAPVCLAHKAVDGNKACREYCGMDGTIDGWITDYPQGCVHTCQAGLWKIALPLPLSEALTGILHVGPFSPDRGGKLSSLAWQGVEDCRIVLAAVAGEIARLLAPWPSAGEMPLSRADQILNYLRLLEGEGRLEDLAGRLNLSVSHTRHLVRECFGKPFSVLSLEVRLQRAAGLLTLTDRALIDIASSLGFCDQSHFTKAFSKYFGLTPHRYRRQHEE